MRARSSVLVAVVSLLAGSLLAGCGSDEPSGPADAAEPDAATSAEAEAFPATVAHKFGETTVDEEPSRVVSVGLTEQDTLLQLGVVPIAVTEWYGEKPFATWPWAEDLLGDAEPEVLSAADGFEFERIAALQPDLIVGTNAGLTAKDYELLSQIAPTIPSVEGSTRYFSSWQDQTMQIAKGLGREADGQALIDEVTDKYAAAAAEHPEWDGSDRDLLPGRPLRRQLYVYPAGLSTDFLTELGFTMTTGLEDYAPEDGAQAEISAENVGLIDADVVVFATENQEMFDELQEFGTIAQLPAVAENRSVYTDETLAGAIYFDTPLSLEYTLERLVPMLDLAAQGQAPREFPA